MKTLRLLFPEWQGCGENPRVSDGAHLMRQAFSNLGDFKTIPIVQDEVLQVEHGVLGLSVNLKNFEQAAAKIQDAAPDRIFMIGGTCGSALVPVAYLNKRYNGDLAVLWLDAHGDLNTPESSPSKHFHGMVLRALLGNCLQELKRHVLLPLEPNQVTLLGVRDLDPPEVEYIDKEKIVALSPEEPPDISKLLAAVKRSGVSNLYIHLDLDFFNPDDFPSVSMPTKGGNSVASLVPILKELNAQFSVVGLNVAEFVPNAPEMAHRISHLFDECGLRIR